MIKIDKLIAQYCLDGIQYKELKQIANIGTGNRNGNEGIENGEYPLYVRSKFIKSIDSYDFDEEAIVIPGEGGIGEIFHYVKGKYALHQRAYRISLINEQILTKFIYYYMMSYFKSFINKLAVSATVSSIRKPMIEKFPVPILPLSVQEEIVKILDKFTQLEAELEAELEARTRQYEFYRNELLAFSGKDVEWKSLSEACDYVDYRGKTPRKKSDGIFLITAKNIKRGYIDYQTSKEYISLEDYELVMRRGVPQLGDILITTEAPCGNVAQINNENIALAQRVIKYRSKNNKLSNNFLKHYLLGKEFQIRLYREATGSTVKGIKGSKLHKIKVPIPSIEEQERIVKILDHFDALVNDISVGLPAEIKARREQYEYYREKLLTFKPLVHS